jgi:hypothetical protein
MEDKNLFSRRLPDEYTEVSLEIQKLCFPMNYQNIPCKSKVIIIGSSTLRVMSNYSDIDSMVVVDMPYSKPKLIFKFYEAFKEKIKELLNGYNHFVPIITDIKCGDKTHWTVKEVLANTKHSISKRFFADCLTDKAFIKVDIVVPYYDRYIEASAVYYVRGLNDEWLGLNFNDLSKADEFFKVLKDTAHIEYDGGKFMKVLKRIFSMIKSIPNKTENNIDLAKKLVIFFRSEIGLISKIASDLATLNLLFVGKKQFSNSFARNELENMRDRLITIYPQILSTDSIKLITEIIDDFDDKDILSVIEKIDKLYGELSNTVNMFAKFFIDKNISKTDQKLFF